LRTNAQKAVDRQGVGRHIAAPSGAAFLAEDRHEGGNQRDEEL